MLYLRKYNESKSLFIKIKRDDWLNRYDMTVSFEKKYISELETIMNNKENTYPYSDPWDNGGVFMLNKYTGGYSKSMNEFTILPNAGIGNTIFIIKQCEDDWFIIHAENSGNDVPSFNGLGRFFAKELM